MESFEAAAARIEAGDVTGLRALLVEDPDLAREVPEGRASLLQDVAVNGGLGRVANQLELARLLLDAGAAVDAPFVAAASVGNVAVGELLLEAGARVDGVGEWTPLEEALYWRNQAFAELLLRAGARTDRLRVVAGLGETARLGEFFDDGGGLRTGQGIHAWPFGELPPEDRSDDPQDVLANALLFACVNGRTGTAAALIERGAPIDRCPPGTHYLGGPLHGAIWKGGLETVKLLVEAGADLALRDRKYDGTPRGWAEHEEKLEIAEYLAGLGAPS